MRTLALTFLALAGCDKPSSPPCPSTEPVEMVTPDPPPEGGAWSCRAMMFFHHDTQEVRRLGTCHVTRDACHMGDDEPAWGLKTMGSSHGTQTRVHTSCGSFFRAFCYRLEIDGEPRRDPRTWRCFMDEALCVEASLKETGDHTGCDLISAS